MRTSPIVLIAACAVLGAQEQEPPRAQPEEAVRAHAQSARLVEVAAQLRLAAYRMGHELAVAACTRVIEATPAALAKATALRGRAEILGEELWETLSASQREQVVADLASARELAADDKAFATACDRLGFACRLVPIRRRGA